MILNDDSYKHLIPLTDPESIATEAFRNLRTNLFYAVLGTPPKVLVLTSPGPREGKSTICANLGVVLAQANKRVLIIDCDLRRPTQHKIFGLRNMQGLVNVLVERRSLYEMWQDSPLPDLKVLTVGPLPPNPAELLDSQLFAELLDQTRGEFDHILLDSPPTQPVSDPMILASQADGVLLVIDSKGTRKGAVRESVHNLQTIGASVIGTVMNNAAVSETGPGYYGDYAYGTRGA